MADEQRPAVELTPEIIKAALSENGRKAAGSRRLVRKICAWPGCGVEFEGTLRAKYHSDACRNADYWRLHAGELVADRKRKRHAQRDAAPPAAPAPADPTGPESGTSSSS